MKINIRDIPSEGLELSEEKLPEDLGLTDDDFYIKFKGPISLKAFVEKVSDTVLAKVHVQGQLETVCARCLETIEDPWTKDFLLDFLVDKSTETIELDDDIRQEMLLNVPDKVLCKEDCKGLCVGCGVNLNNEACRCKKIEVTGMKL
jgi:uncharacterized protein